jgi:biotin operon repressor
MSRNFGVEIECINITERRAVEVLLAAGVNVSTNTNYRHEGYTQWKVIHDSSIQGAQGCEVVSPILNGEAGLIDVKKVCKALSDAGVTVNKSCGLHVHVDASGLTGEWIRNIVKRYNKFENTIDSFMPVSRRARNNSRYCDSVSQMIYVMESSYSRQWNSVDAASVCAAATNRFHKINLTCYPRYNTIEFRHHSGSVNGSKITNWVNFVLAFVEASKPETVVTPVASGLPMQARRRGRPSRATIQAVAALHAAATATQTNEPAVVANVYNLSSYSQRKVYQILETNVGNWLTKATIAQQSGLDIDSVASYISAIRAGLGVDIENSRSRGYRLVSVNVVNATRAPVTPAARQQAPAPVMVNDEWTRGIPPHIVSYYIERASDLNA